MFNLEQILDTVLISPSRNIFQDVPVDVTEFVSLDILDRLDGHSFVVIAANLFINR